MAALLNWFDNQGMALCHSAEKLTHGFLALLPDRRLA